MCGFVVARLMHVVQRYTIHLPEISRSGFGDDASHVRWNISVWKSARKTMHVLAEELWRPDRPI